jgi:hypothetical protein
MPRSRAFTNVRKPKARAASFDAPRIPRVFAAATDSSSPVSRPVRPVFSCCPFFLKP